MTTLWEEQHKKRHPMLGVFLFLKKNLQIPLLRGILLKICGMVYVGITVVTSFYELI